MGELSKLFTPEQVKALEEHFAPRGHHHGPTEISIDEESNLDEWSDSVEERLDVALEEDLEEED